MNILLTAGIAFIGTLLSVAGIYNYLPLDILQFNNEQTFGSTITTIAGSDTLSSSRAVINTNFSNLNTDKFELSAWYATTTPVSRGGTGSTTLSANQILLGNGTSVGVVSGWGTSGQLLTSNGAGSAPSWQTNAFDSTASYNMTGSYFGAKNLLASSTAANPITLNGLTYSTPSVRAASSTVLMENGSGGLTWNDSYSRMIYIATTSISAADQTSSTTILQATIPANTLGTSGAVKCEFRGVDFVTGLSTNANWVEFSYGNTTTTISVTPGSTMSNRNGELTIFAKGATNAQQFTFLGWGVGSNGTEYKMYKTGAFWVDSTLTHKLNIISKSQNTAQGLSPETIICTAIK